MVRVRLSNGYISFLYENKKSKNAAEETIDVFKSCSMSTGRIIRVAQRALSSTPFPVGPSLSACTCAFELAPQPCHRHRAVTVPHKLLPPFYPGPTSGIGGGPANRGELQLGM